MKNRLKPEMHLSEFTLSKLNDPQFEHMKYLLFWPIYGIMFALLERGITYSYYYPMHCWLDDLIPFNEWMVIPYLFWFIFLPGMLLYTCIYEPHSFRKMMQFIILSYSTTIVIYILFPTCQYLRPHAFERDNFLTRFLHWFYGYDTNTNVCPSIHVIGSLAVMFASWHCEKIGRGWKNFCTVTAILISLSTVFIKQHSILDVVAAGALSFVCYLVVYVWDVPERLGEWNAQRRLQREREDNPYLYR